MNSNFFFSFLSLWWAESVESCLTGLSQVRYQLLGDSGYPYKRFWQIVFFGRGRVHGVKIKVLLPDPEEWTWGSRQRNGHEVQDNLCNFSLGRELGRGKGVRREGQKREIEEKRKREPDRDRQWTYPRTWNCFLHWFPKLQYFGQLMQRTDSF